MTASARVRGEPVALIVVVALALAVRLAGAGDRLTSDEGYSWLVGSAPDVGSFLARLAAFENTPPLFYAGLDLFSTRYLTALLPLSAALLACGVALVPWRPALPLAAVVLLALGVAVFVHREGRELEPDLRRAEALARAVDARVILTNSSAVAFYLRHLQVVLDRPPVRARPRTRAGNLRPSPALCGGGPPADRWRAATRPGASRDAFGAGRRVRG